MLRISSTIHAVTYSLQAMPILIQALIMRKRIMEAVTVLFELEYFAEEDIDNSGKFEFSRPRLINPIYDSLPK